MGYRFSDKPINPEDTLPRFEVRNGATIHMEFDCYYWTPESMNAEFYFRDPHHPPVPYSHFYPEPWKPQPDFADLRHLPVDFTEIDLQGEGYNKLSIVFDDSTIASKLSSVIGFDTGDDVNTVHCSVTANLDKFEDEQKETRFTVFAKGSGNNMQDALCRGILVILPGPPYSS